MIFFGRHIRELMAAERCRSDGLRSADQEQFRAAVVAERVNKDIALASLQKQLDGLNELRKGVAMSVEVAALDKVVDDVKSRVERMEATSTGRASGSKDYIAWVVAAVSVIATIITVGVMLSRL